MENLIFVTELDGMEKRMTPWYAGKQEGCDPRGNKM